MNFLDEYKKQLENDKNKRITEDSSFDSEYDRLVKKRIEELENDPSSIENQYNSRMSEMVKINEQEMIEQGLIKNEEIKKIYVKRAYCQECGKELLSNGQPLLNPFTFEKICKHTCSECGKVYNLEYAYPRLVIENNNGDEIPVFLR